MGTSDNTDSISAFRVINFSNFISPSPSTIYHVFAIYRIFLARFTVSKNNATNLPIAILNKINKLSLIEYVSRSVPIGQVLILIPAQSRRQQSSQQ